MRGRRIDWKQFIVAVVVIVILNILSQVFDWGYIFY